MNSTKANLLNSITLISLGLWGFFEAFNNVGWKAGTALIPVVFGVIFLLCYNGLKNENKLISHIVVLLTALLLGVLLIMRLPVEIEEGGIKLFRISAMILTCSLAMIFFIKSFIEARTKG